MINLILLVSVIIVLTVNLLVIGIKKEIKTQVIHYLVGISFMVILVDLVFYYALSHWLLKYAILAFAIFAMIDFLYISRFDKSDRKNIFIDFFVAVYNSALLGIVLNLFYILTIKYLYMLNLFIQVLIIFVALGLYIFIHFSRKNRIDAKIVVISFLILTLASLVLIIPIQYRTENISDARNEYRFLGTSNDGLVLKNKLYLQKIKTLKDININNFVNDVCTKDGNIYYVLGSTLYYESLNGNNPVTLLSVDKSTNIPDPYIDLVYFNNDIYVSTPEGLYYIDEDNNLKAIHLLSYGSEEVENIDFYSAFYTKHCPLSDEYTLYYLTNDGNYVITEGFKAVKTSTTIETVLGLDATWKENLVSYNLFSFNGDVHGIFKYTDGSYYYTNGSLNKISDDKDFGSILQYVSSAYTLFYTDYGSLYNSLISDEGDNFTVYGNTYVLDRSELINKLEIKYIGQKDTLIMYSGFPYIFKDNGTYLYAYIDNRSTSYQTFYINIYVVKSNHFALNNYPLNAIKGNRDSSIPSLVKIPLLGLFIVFFPFFDPKKFTW